MPRKTTFLKSFLLLVAGNLGWFGHQAAASEKPGAGAWTLDARVERARDKLIRELGAEKIPAEKAGRVAQWYNWPNWNNWFNGWRNW